MRTEVTVSHEIGGIGTLLLLLLLATLSPPHTHLMVVLVIPVQAIIKNPLLEHECNQVVLTPYGQGVDGEDGQLLLLLLCG